MISKYQTIPHEEETLSAPPTKQNGGRKVAGALLAFALAAGLVAAAAGRNSGATLQENTMAAAQSDERLELNDDFRGDVTFSEGEVRIVCDEKEQCENGRVRAHDPSDQVFVDCQNTNACYDSRVHAKGPLTVRCVGPPEPYTGMCADSRFTSDVSINLICDGRDACDRVTISGPGHLTLTCTHLSACRHMNIQTSCTCTTTHCHDATNRQCTGPLSSSAQHNAVAPIASFTTRPAFTVAFSPDGNRLAVGTAARVAGEGIGGLALYDVAALRDSGGGVDPTLQIEPDSAVLSAAFHPDRVVIVEANDQPAVGAWNYDTGDEADWGLAASGRAVAFAPTGVLAVCCEGSTVKLFNPDGSLLDELAFEGAATGWVKPSLAWDGRGRLLAMGRTDRIVIFDTSRGTVDKIDVSGVTWGLAFSLNGIYLAVGGPDQNLVVYENAGAPVSGPYVPLDRDFPVSDFASVTAIAFKDDRTLAYGDEAGALFIDDLSVQAPPSVFETGRPGINELAYSKDGLLAVAAGPGTAGEVFLFD